MKRQNKFDPLKIGGRPTILAKVLKNLNPEDHKKIQDQKTW